jgi:hypothetical protein
VPRYTFAPGQHVASTGAQYPRGLVYVGGQHCGFGVSHMPPPASTGQQLVVVGAQKPVGVFPGGCRNELPGQHRGKLVAQQPVPQAMGKSAEQVQAPRVAPL